MSELLLIARCPPYPLHLGDRLIIWHLARELAGAGWQIDLLAFAQQPEDYEQQEHYAAFFRSVQLFAEPQRGPADYLARLLRPGLRFPRSGAAAWSPEMWQAMRGALAAHSYDAVHLFGSVQVYEFYNALEGRPALITPYESFSLYMERLTAAEQNTLRRALLRARHYVAQRYESWMFGPYACVSVVAQPDREALLRLDPSLRVEVVPNGIETDYFCPQPDVTREAATLLFVGNYAYQPNVDAALTLAREVLPLVRQQVPQAHLLLVGHGPPPQVQALAGPHVTVTGAVPDLRPCHARASVFVCPLRLGAGIKNKVLEALAMATPVAASPLAVDGIAVQHEQHALVVPPEETAAAVLRLLADPALGARLGAAARKLVETEYSWAGAAQRYRALYASLNA